MVLIAYYNIEKIRIHYGKLRVLIHSTLLITNDI